ncbi:MAG: DUF1919 domain-containing protein [Eubacterium sp.]
MLNKIINVWKNSKILDFIMNCENKYFRSKCRNTEFTLLTPNCMAGLIYSRLGEKFNSPTINTSINTSDFIKFINDLDYYLSCDVEQMDIADSQYPVGIIKGKEEKDDIRINFVHYDDFETARQKWNERKKRIIKDNMYVIICDIDDIYEPDYKKVGYISDDDLSEFEKFKCNNRALLTRRHDRTQEYAQYIKPDYHRPFPLVYMNRDIIGLNGFERHFDFVSFLNKK